MTENSETNPPPFLRLSWLYAPALAALYPVIYTYTDSLPETNLRDAVICAAVVLIAAVALTCLLQLVFSGAKRASLAAVVVIVWCFTFAGYLRFGRRAIETLSKSSLNEYVLMFLWLVLLFVALLLLFRIRWSEQRTARVYRFVKLACLFAVIFALCQGVSRYWRGIGVKGVAASMWESDLEIIPATWRPDPIVPRRDIYYLLYDRYASEESLRHFFGFDNSEFDSELEKRGFVVDRNAVTSYPMTSTSMASTLNMRYLNSRVASNSDYFAAVQANEVGKLLIKAGYKYLFFGNQYEGLRKSSIAKWNLKVSVMPSEFADTLVAMTPFRPLIGRQHKRVFTLDKSAAVAEVAKDPELTFTYSHFLVPHPPYAFARDGSRQSETNRATRPEQELYIDQLVATNHLILQTIDGILQSSAVEPIIVLQADEGPYLMAGEAALSRDQQMAKRLGILNAILIPDKAVRDRLPKPLMPVNTFRFLFKEYFDAPIDLLPDRVFYWETPESTGAAAPGTRILDVTSDLLPRKDVVLGGK